MSNNSYNPWAINVNHRRVAGLAKKTPKRQLDVVKDGPLDGGYIGEWSQRPTPLDERPKAPAPKMSLPPCLAGNDTEAGKQRAATVQQVPQKVQQQQAQAAGHDTLLPSRMVATIPVMGGTVRIMPGVQDANAFIVEPYVAGHYDDPAVKAARAALRKFKQERALPYSYRTLLDAMAAAARDFAGAPCALRVNGLYNLGL